MILIHITLLYAFNQDAKKGHAVLITGQRWNSRENFRPQMGSFPLWNLFYYILCYMGLIQSQILHYNIVFILYKTEALKHAVAWLCIQQIKESCISESLNLMSSIGMLDLLLLIHRQKYWLWHQPKWNYVYFCCFKLLHPILCRICSRFFHLFAKQLLCNCLFSFFLSPLSAAVWA